MIKNNTETLMLGSLIKELTKKRIADLLPHWQMTPAERAMMLTLLRETKPDVAIEIGTAQGGSLAAISTFAKKVYSLDIDPECERKLKRRFKNVSFKCGNSGQTIPLVLEEIKRQKRNLQFVLVDGDHSREGVRRDIGLILKYRPRVFIYGAGIHTRVLLGAVPELAEYVVGIIDRASSGKKLLGWSSLKPENFNASACDVMLYSSKSSELAMYKNMRHHKVEHILLYNKLPAASLVK